MGEIVEREWRNIPGARDNVWLDNYVIMPNHLHGLIVIDAMTDRRASQTIKAGSLGAIIGQFKAAVSRTARLRRLDHGRPIWQRNYYDRVVRDEVSLNEFRRYIIENPAHWRMDSLYVA